MRIDVLPASIMRPPMFVVGAVDRYSKRATFSGGKGSQGTDGDGILTVSAPGKDVKIAVANTNGYGVGEGTSYGKKTP